MLKLNELVCVDLLLAGEEHLPRFPTLTRGLLAVLLYYDGKRRFVFVLSQILLLTVIVLSPNPIDSCSRCISNNNILVDLRTL